MSIGLLLGSFNPIHKAHLAVARWALASTLVDRVWIVPTPQNPRKTSDDLASFEDRLSMARLATEGIDGVEVCAVEGELSAPHYTINTVEYLTNQMPDEKFFILCGSDIIAQLPSWHRIDSLRGMVEFIEYPRVDDGALKAVDGLETYCESSSAIRQGELTDRLDPRVYDYIVNHGLYFASPVSRARRAMADGDFSTVINLGVEFSQDEQVVELSKMARDILAFRCVDIYNP